MRPSLERFWYTVGLLLCVALTAAASLAGESRPLAKVAFPPIADWSSLHILLERTPCLGTCPHYTVDITGDGTIAYVGIAFVGVKGARTAHIPEKAVRDLYDAFAKAEFFWTFDDYTASITDQPTATITIRYDGHVKTVKDYAGDHAGMPKAVKALEKAIDRAAGTAQWVKVES